MPWAAWSGRFRRGGVEHDVFQDEAAQRWLKVTKGGGLIIDTDFVLGKVSQKWLAVPFVREATPLEYLVRTVLFNEVFADDIRLEGVTEKPGGELGIITSQPHVRGRPATPDEVALFMEVLGFCELEEVRAGRRDSESYFRATDRVAVFDTHGENFLWFEGSVLPIDALICRADDDLTAFLLLPPEYRRREVRFKSRLVDRRTTSRM